MKRTKLGTKSKKATPARKPASPRRTTRAKTKTGKLKKPAAPNTKSRPAAKRKKILTPPKRTAKIPATGVARKLSGQPTQPAKVARRIRAPLTLKVAAPGDGCTPPKTRAKLKAVSKKKVATRVTSTRSAKQKTFARKPTRVSKPALPAFLLEGDEPSFLTEAGAAEKFSLGPSAPPDHFDEGNAPLPASYGTGKLFLTARDPHWLYAHWDLPHEEQFRHNAISVDRHLILRLHDESKPDKFAAEIHVHPESKHWFVHVEQAGQTYSTELGYYRAGRKWKSLATSTPQRTPPDNISADSNVEFATIPTELSFATMLELLRGDSADVAAQNIPLARAIESIRQRTQQDFPEAMHIADWTPEQEQALAEILAADRAGIALPSSHDSAGDENQPGSDSSFIESPSSYVSSFFGGAEGQDFWLNVNTELILYGATEPNANVSLAGNKSPCARTARSDFNSRCLMETM